MRDPVRISIARLCYQATEHPAVGEWLARTATAILADSRHVVGLNSFWVDRSPVYCARNYAVEIAKQQRADFLVMIDHDMLPDYIPNASAFWDTSFAFAMQHDGPCMIGAPCARADGSVCVFREVETDDTIGLEFWDQEFAATATGIEKVPAVSLALSLIDMRCFEAVKKPYFQFGFADEALTTVSWGEESFGVKLTEAGVPVFVNWDCWAGHSKTIIHGKPVAKHGGLWLNDPELNDERDERIERESESCRRREEE